MEDKSKEYPELFAQTKKTVDNLLVDPRKIDREIEFPEEIEISEIDNDTSIYGQLKAFAKKCSNNRVKITPCFNFTDTQAEHKRACGIKISIDF